MGYHDRCQGCWGKGKTWEGEQCRTCGGSGKMRPYRRNLTIGDGNTLGWDKLPDFWTKQRERAGDKNCAVCARQLTGRKRTFCGEGCRRKYVWHVWKAAHWQKRAVCARDGAACRECGEVFEAVLIAGGPPFPTFSQLQLDHIKPLEQGGDESPDNCQLLCEPCHKSKSAHETRSRAARVKVRKATLFSGQARLNPNPPGASVPAGE